MAPRLSVFRISMSSVPGISSPGGCFARVSPISRLGEIVLYDEPPSQKVRAGVGNRFSSGHDFHRGSGTVFKENGSRPRVQNPTNGETVPDPLWKTSRPPARPAILPGNLAGLRKPFPTPCGWRKRFPTPPPYGR